MQTCTIYGCGDCSGASENRRFFTKEEKIGMLKEYRQALEKEAKGVGERISELENQKDEVEE
ncbi:hypothetical protein HYW75_01195 [Candidatus Pacearchaeota archaeon]|nr:hypothetical protein [Candidatus Pacearchaeota archaeon]